MSDPPGRSHESDGARAPVGGVVLCHGFARGHGALLALAWRCQQWGLRTVRPRYASVGRRGMNAVTHVRALADGLMTLPGILDGPLVLGGHSAGAAVVVAMADHLADRGVRVRGLVLIDGVDNRAHMAIRVLRSTTLLQMTPVMLIDGEPSRCNQYGDLTRTLLAEGPGVMGWRVHGAGHGDVERWIPGAPGVPEARDADRRARPRLAYRIACGDASSNAVAERVQVLSATSIAFLAGQGCGMGVSGQSTMWPAAQQRAAAIVGMAGVHGIAPGTVTTLLPGSIREG